MMASTTHMHTCSTTHTSHLAQGHMCQHTHLLAFVQEVGNVPVSSFPLRLIVSTLGSKLTVSAIVLHHVCGENGGV